MNITTRKRPWDSTHRKGSTDPRYHSARWKAHRKAFMQTDQMVKCNDGTTKLMSNRLCIQCFREGIVKELHTVDHIQRVKDGGNFFDFNNNQGLCARHHAVKSANEGNTTRHGRGGKNVQ